MPRTLRLFLAFSLSMAALAHAQTQVKGRVLVMVDTSGSMAWHFTDCVGAGGDGFGSPALFCDNSMGAINGKTFACNQNVACTAANGAAALFPVANVNNPSRLYSAKAALQDVINSAGGDLDFGLERYALSSPNEVAIGFSMCPDASDCCNTQINGTTRGRCAPRFLADYPPVPNNVVCQANFVDGNGNPLPSDCNLTFVGGCGTSGGCAGNCTATQGGQILIQPGNGSSQQVLPWIDFTEDFCSSNGVVGGPPRNPELRASGGTPLAGSVRTARIQWYQPIFTASNGGNCNPNITPLCDQQINCRPYVNVVMTDGAETCESANISATDPATAVQELTGVNNTNPVKTYVLGMAFAQNQTCANNNNCNGGACQNGVCHCNGNNQCGTTCDGFPYQCVNGVCTHPAVGTLNTMAQNGGTGTARFVNNQADIEAAFADIAASSVLFESCNGKDDNCNTFIDEGLGVYQECQVNGDCASGTCNAGRCTCANNGQCKAGFLCGGGFCLPSCSTGVGACLRTGVKKCSMNGPACCVNDGQAACVPLAPGPAGVEVCNGIDDNCNGLIDENNVCAKCTPQPETCNGLDDDCDGVIDNAPVDINQPCGLNLGVCKPGTTACVNGNNQDITMGGVPDAKDHLICKGETGPQPVTCNGCDNDCDGVTDAPTQPCYSGPNGTNGVGICHGGTQKCTATMCPQAAMFGACIGEVLPQKEICDGVDNDCDGQIDDVQGANQPCCPSGKCGVGVCTAGTMQCSGGALACIGGTGPSPEICDGLDNDCNGMVDDVPGVGNPCVPMGGCNGTLQCDVQKMGVVCVSNNMKNPEICNGVDDDCDGMVDEEPDIDQNDNRLGQPCGNPQMLPPPCKAGKTICQNGMVVCQGAVGPGMEVCDGQDNDCDGTPDNGAMCPPQFVCYMGNCDPLCQQGEFPCPGGYSPVMVNGMCICVADKTCDPPCANGTVCDPQTGQCIDPCSKVNCPAGLKCVGGSCYGCEKFGCTDQCTVCDKATHLCVADKCCNVNCGMEQFCDPSTGMCVNTCPNGCPKGQVCKNGNCVQDPCSGKHCPEGQTCDPSSGNCVADPCATMTCGQNLACCAGKCMGDPCLVTNCPEGTVCHVSSLTCATSCDAAPVNPKDKDQVVGAGGGGFACAAAPGAPGGRGTGALALLFAALAIAALRRRR